MNLILHGQELLRGAESKEAAEVGDEVDHRTGKIGHFAGQLIFLGLRTLWFPIDSTYFNHNPVSTSGFL